MFVLQQVPADLTLLQQLELEHLQFKWTVKTGQWERVTKSGPSAAGLQWVVQQATGLPIVVYEVL